MLYQRLKVHGRVQLVLFRDSTRRRARKLNLKGLVRNLRDGSVEILAAGPEEKINELFDWAKKGPPLASVKQYERDSVELPLVCEDFHIMI